MEDLFMRVAKLGNLIDDIRDALDIVERGYTGLLIEAINVENDIAKVKEAVLDVATPGKK